MRNKLHFDTTQKYLATKKPNKNGYTNYKFMQIARGRGAEESIETSNRSRAAGYPEDTHDISISTVECLD
jgi:hypothetical protein